jgi:hypothetical protein
MITTLGNLISTRGTNGRHRTLREKFIRETELELERRLGRRRPQQRRHPWNRAPRAGVAPCRFVVTSAAGD